MAKSKNFLSRIPYFRKLLPIVLLDQLDIAYILGIVWLLIFFVFYPKQAFMQGLLESWFVSKGLVYYKDFMGAYLPIFRIMLVPVHQVFGFSQWTTVVLAPVNSLATYSVIYFYAKKNIKSYFYLIAPVFFLIWDPYLGGNHFATTSFLGLTVAIMFFVWLDFLKKPSRVKAVVISFLASISLFTLQIVALFILIIGLNLLWTIYRKADKRMFMFSFMAFAAPIFYVLVWFGSRGALSDLWYWNVAYYFGGYPYGALGTSPENIIFFAAIHLPLFLYWLTDHENIWTILVLLSLPLTFWFAILHPARFQISLPIFAFILAYSLANLKKIKYRVVRSMFYFLLLVIVAFNFVSAKHIYKNTFSKLATKNVNFVVSKLYPNDPLYSAAVWIKENTNKDDKILAIADPVIYIDSDRLLVNGRGAMNVPFVYLPINSFAQEIKSKTPDYWVIDERMWDRFTGMGYQNVNNYFEQLFRCQPIVASFDYITIRKNSGDISCF